jgi:hypothetical protein
LSHPEESAVGKIKRRTFIEEFDEQGNLISEWESKEFYPEPKDVEKTESKLNIFKDFSAGGVIPSGATRPFVPNVSFTIPAGCYCDSCQGAASSHGSLRS